MPEVYEVEVRDGRQAPAVLLEDYGLIRAARFLNMAVPDFVERLKRQPEWFAWASALEPIEQRAEAAAQQRAEQRRNRKR